MKRKILFGLLSCLPVFSYASILPDTPVPFKLGVGVIDHNTVYIGLGSAGQSWFKLNLNDAQKHWEKIADFPGVARDQAVSATTDGKIYVFGGAGKDKDGLTHSLNDAYMYDPQSNTWVKMMTHCPQSLVGSAMFARAGKLYTIGGVNENIFNGYFEDVTEHANNSEMLKKINHDYFNKKYDDVFYSKNILSFDPATRQWSSAGAFPYGSAGATVIVQKNAVTVINGEVKPGLRTNAAYSGTVDKSMQHWKAMPGVENPDGVAGGFGGTSQGYIIFAGGAGFTGSRDNYDKGKLYAHEGITKHYSQDINIYKAGKWTNSTALPYGIAYGVSIPWSDGLLIIGGETDGGKAITQSIYVKINNGKVSITQ